MKTKLYALTAASIAALIVGCTNGTTPPTPPTPSTSPMAGSPSPATPSTSPSAMPTGEPTAAPSGQYVQVERLARPAINEGLILTNELLNTWNMVPPSADTTPAAQPIAAEATATLKALGNTQERIDALFSVLLPDVMRIDTTRESGYAGTAANPLGNLTASQRPIGGRKLTDDVMDATLLLIVPESTASAVPGLRSDNVAYSDAHRPPLSTFPYLVPPH